MKVLQNIIRILLSLTLMFSGFVKAVDPLGTQYKLQDYLAAMDLWPSGVMHDWGTLVLAVLLAGFEFTLGVLLFFAIRRRLATRLALLFMLVMTGLTVWIYFADPVSDCGCFGDALVLSNGETLLKNIILLLFCIALSIRPLQMPRLISETNQWIVENYSCLFILAISMYALYLLPLIDFRPYHIGANIPEGMEIPEGAPQAEFSTTLVYEKDGVQKEFDVDNIPDSTWTFVDSRSIQLTKGYEPPIHDFSINALNIAIDKKTGKMDLSSEDITDEVLEDTSFTFLLVAPYLEKADDSQFGSINLIADYAQKNGYRFLCLTASNPPAILRWCDLTGADYSFANTDEITLKTIIRSSPGLVLLKNGTIYQKWSCNNLPRLDDNTPPLPQTQYVQLKPQKMTHEAAVALMWYILPLLVLTVLDRLFAWTKYVRRRNRYLKHRASRKAGQQKNTENQITENQITKINTKQETL